MLEHLRIKLAEADAGSLVADRVTLQCYSSCARGLPASAEEWDLRQLLVEGQPVQRETVVAYLNAISQHLNNEPMIDDQGDNPTRSLKKLAQLLAFADAVGSSKGLLLALDGNVSAKTFYAEATLGERELQLQAVDCHFFRDTSLDLSIMGSSQLTAKKLAKASSSEDKERFRQQLVQQVECLLYLAFKLQLPKLQAAVLTCISCNSCWGGSLLNTVPAMTSVVSARVLSAGTAAGCRAVRDAFATCASTELCTFVSGAGCRHLLQPLGLTKQQKQPISFKAEALEDFCCFKKGQVLQVKLDLFKTSLMTLQVDESDSTSTPHLVNLALGRQLLMQPSS